LQLHNYHRFAYKKKLLMEDTGLLLRELWTIVIQYLGLKELLQLSLCNKKLLETCDNDLFWQQRLETHFPSTSITTNASFKEYKSHSTNKQLYKALSNSVQSNKYFNCGDYFNNSFPFGGDNVYYFIIEFDSLEQHVKSIMSPTLRSQINAKLSNDRSKFYCSGVEFYCGSTKTVSMFDTSFDKMQTFGVKWGSYLSKFQIMHDETVVIVLGQVNVDGSIVDGAWNTSGPYGLYASRRITPQECHDILQLDIEDWRQRNVRKKGRTLLLKNNYEVTERRYAYQLREGKWKISVTPNLEMELFIRFRESMIRAHMVEPFALTGTIKDSNVTNIVIGVTFGCYVSFCVLEDGQVMPKYAVICEGLEQQNVSCTPIIIDHMQGFSYDSKGITGAVYGQFMSDK
jgi:hypothetical protein